MVDRVRLGEFGPAVVWWEDDERVAGPGKAVYVGQIFAGFIEPPGVRQDRRWVAWVNLDDAGYRLGDFATEAQAQQAVLDAVLEALADNFIRDNGT